MSKEWTREDYIEEDVRRHSEEIKALTKLSLENAAMLREILKEVERRQAPVEDHEDRLRGLEKWQAKTGTYWAITTFLIAGVVGFIFNNIRGLFKFVT